MNWTKLFQITGIILILLLGVSILVPTGIHCSPTSEKARSRSQFVGYNNALQQFRVTYDYFPTFFEGKESFNLGQGNNSEKFMQTLSGRDIDGKPVAMYGNRRSTPFYSFSEHEYCVDKKTGKRQIVDAYGNPNIIISIDHDNDGFVMSAVDGEFQKVRGKVAIFTLPLNDKEAVSTQ